jgi:hypothetical protein
MVRGMSRYACVLALVIAGCGSTNQGNADTADGPASSGADVSTTRPRIAVTTEPAGARVFIDDTDRGASPVELPVDPRLHRFAIDAAGHRRFEGEWNAVETELYSVYAVYPTSAPSQAAGDSANSTTNAVLAHREELIHCGLDGPQALHKVTVERDRNGHAQMVVVQAYLPLEKIRCVAQHAVAWPFFGSGFAVTDTFLGPANEEHHDTEPSE